ncbi:uncharacterized protein BJ212DRAFT_1478042 [Suillus subaureus]|uniref:Uncharacterized protein n=1 Tax=Suillus subaureus TaxID=48587 RepID=A0A9P7JGB0_9AGAM|nr:uncharacterized protein BJ212DRAFT_1478042 [Suillus subaureus]KAG1820946.1 hypothetical protein BJ212DRAFT_1478042 [Suillus subaureus]
MTDRDYVVTGHGTNKEGNHWCTRDYGSRGTGHHYSNQFRRLLYYENPNGSKYYENADGKATFTTPDDHIVKLQK